MQVLEVHPVSIFRTRLPEFVRAVAANAALRIYVGAYRKPDAVLMSSAAEMPRHIRDALLSTFVVREADRAITDFGARRGHFAHIGDPFGKILAWLWRTNPDEAMQYLTQYLMHLRDHHPNRPEPPIRLDDVLTALRLAIDITDDEYTAICDQARTEVPSRYGEDPNT
ncbi:hypothetical protein [Nocardia suismassiliense]|uniref:hypothetical protein n=1 Tax=Nocardia suismassiliense TaxID=2077092 RepID=UPI00131EDC58|nr:hypothetical protein [Nocardia suismassiliense]